jgi:3-methyl-2-oxobutanoate hydroxymethyltransferase
MRITIGQIKEMKREGSRIAVLTAYDYPTARLVDEAGIPLILVGDSLGQVVLGYDSTIPVTMEDMLHHTKAVVRGVKNALVVADMPFMSYHISTEQALTNAARFIQEAGAQAVKLEGGTSVAGKVQRMVECGIPVMGHIGLTPQSIHQLGGYKAQGKTLEAARRLVQEAAALEDAGAFAVVLETIPAQLAQIITHRLSVPTIGIGAGSGCDGQVQVIHDMLGLLTDYTPRHARRYAHVAEVMSGAINGYKKDVVDGSFPTEKESVSMDEAVLAELIRELSG